MNPEPGDSPAPSALPNDGPEREIIHADALSWLATREAPPDASVITSLPDVSELPELGFEGWRSWFLDTARRVIEWVPEDGLSIFYQSDIRRGGTWVDKGYLVQRAAEAAGAALMWHKIVCRKPPGTITHGRASYSHLVCLSRVPRPNARRPGPDVLFAGEMPWSRAMGFEACRLACRFLKDETHTRVVVDPFCGRGTVPAIANSFGFDAIGVDRSLRCCRAARRLNLTQLTEATEGATPQSEDPHC